METEPAHGKTNNLHRQKTKAQISFTINLKPISAFVFTTWIVQFLYFLNPKFLASYNLLRLNSPVCVGPGRIPNCWFSYDQAQLLKIFDCLVHFQSQKHKFLGSFRHGQTYVFILSVSDL